MSYYPALHENCIFNPIINQSVRISDNFLLSIRADLSNYENGKFLYWYVWCNFPYTKGSNIEHPFKYADFEGQTENEIWGIVADNDLIRTILRYLSMPKEELQEKCGRVDQLEYRATLIKTLQNLWD